MRPCVTVAKHPFTSTSIMLPYYTDDRITTLCTPWTTPSVNVVRNSYVHEPNRLHMITVPKSDAEILNKVMDGSPLTRKVIYGHQKVIQGQGCFTKHGPPRAIPPVVKPL